MKVPFTVLLLAVSSSLGHTQGPDRACVRRCVKQGSKYGLWSDNHVYTLEPQLKASRFAAENVRVIGDLSNDTIQIKIHRSNPAVNTAQST